MTFRNLTVVLALVLGGSACDGFRTATAAPADESKVSHPPAKTSTQTPPREPTAAKKKFHYSPFVVQVLDSSMEFTTITFKDVGLHRDSLEPNDPILETIAESLAYSLQTSSELEVTASVVEYDESLVDPSNHLSCETNHLYVDVWNGRDRWGYSLWSGCSEADNFAWEEFEIPPGEDDLPGRVLPLADEIAKTVARAHASQCFTKHC